MTDTAQTGLLHIEDMHCGACVAKLDKALKDVAEAFRPSVTTRTAEVAWGDGRSPKAVLDAVQSAGFRAQWIRGSTPAHAGDTHVAERRANMLRIGLATLLTMQVMMLAVPSYFGGVAPAADALMRYTQWLIATPVVLYSGWPFLRGAFEAIRQRSPSMDLPVGLAVSLAYSASVANVLRGAGEVYFDSATMFVTLLLIGRAFEARGRHRASRRLTDLLAAQPRTARRVAGDHVEEVALSVIVAGDTIETPPGEAVAVDGILQSRVAALSEAVINGESTPVERSAGDKLVAGSVVVSNAPVRCTATATAEQSTLARIAQLSHHALAQRTRLVQLTDRIAGHFISVVLVAAAVTFWFWADAGFDHAFGAALAVLVASCPCALSLASPATLAACVGRLAKHGVLVANSDGLLQASRADTIVLDKTGTLTSDALRLSEMVTAPHVERAWALRVAAGLESASRHPIARAFDGIDALKLDGCVQLPGGVEGVLDGQRLRMTTLAANDASQLNIDTNDGRTWLALVNAQDTLLAAYALAGDLTDGAVALARGLDGRAILLSGDAPGPTQRVADSLGLSRWKAQQTAADKLAFVQAERRAGRRVLAVGDGANDAALLAAADCSVAMGQGTALAQTSADLILLDNRVTSLLDIQAESARCHSRIRQNMVWAISYNVLVFPLAFSGWLTPWLAALGMSISSLLVVGNAIRGVRNG